MFLTFFYCFLFVLQINETTFERESGALACKSFPGKHSYDNVAIMIQGVHTYYDLDVQKFVATITDNGSNFVKAFKEFGVVLFHSDLYGNLNTSNSQ